ncbi:uncharacterized protein ATNIH1004_003572 [Aspergillus tanneri]|uniref:Major facilitator superfamily (MFS) profile domain-containing protein n=1 Tax=Aspergillus tanneri TaxID=1220188 RepID=A0A5M9N173_9EURO|nr:uncharacterized protein ATNIH1004_003572 [Aspergillus tanneri]KAA8650883.1 hypothetical protein ATNIH1004_003572 [Aspergillus tanneri]
MDSKESNSVNLEKGDTRTESSTVPLKKSFFRRLSPQNGPNKLAQDMLQQSLHFDQAQLEADSVKVRRKLDFLVLPMMMTTYMLSFLDKQTLNYSNAYGLQKDTRMTGDDYPWVVSALYFGWLCGAWPWNFLLQRVPIAKMVGGMLFIVGILTIAWGFVILAYLPDGPHNAKMLSEYERVVAVWRVSQNQMGIKDSAIKTHQIKEALLDGRCYLLFITGMGIGILNSGVTNFMSAIIKGLNFDPLRTSLMQAPGGAFEIVGCLLLGYVSQSQNMLSLSVILGCLPGMIGLIGLLTIPIDRRYALLAMCWMQNFVGAPIILNWTIPGVNVAGHTKRTATLGVYFVSFVVGNIVGPHMFLSEEVPRYPTAIKGLLGTYCAVILFQSVYALWCWIENKRRDRSVPPGAFQENLWEGYQDLTDKENKHFRYRL